MQGINYNYKEIGRIIVNRFEEREKKLMKRPDAKFARGWAWACDLNKCVGILEDLQKLNDLNKHQQWLLKEIKCLVPNVNYLDEFYKWIKQAQNGIEFIRNREGKFDVDNLDDLKKLNEWASRKIIDIKPLEPMLSNMKLDEFGVRICLCSATIAYCAQFGLEDFEVFYNIYKEVLKIKGLECLNPLPR